MSSIAERKQLLHKYSRCFVCVKKGHIARNCKLNTTCNNCGGNTIDLFVKTKVISPAFHIGMETRVALQTA